MAGITWSFDALSLVVFLFPVFLLARLTGLWLRKPLTPRMRFKFAVSILLLLWGSYYANRAWPYTLYLHIFLLTLLLADFMPTMKHRVIRWGSTAATLRFRVPALWVFLVLMLGPAVSAHCITSVKTSWRATLRRMAVPLAGGAERISGVWLTPEESRKWHAQKGFLDALPKDRSVVFASEEQFLLQLETGRRFALPVQDLYYESFNDKSFDCNLSAVRRLAPDYMLLDEAKGRREFGQDVQRRLSPDYVPVGVRDGWIVLRHINAQP